MANFQIIVGSVLGASEYVADAMEQTLTSGGHSAEIFLQPSVAALDPEATWIICSSTHGAGDLPDNIQPFADEMQGTTLPDTGFLVVGLGDSSYDTFCNAAMTLERLLLERGGKLLHPALHIDVLTHPIPEDVAVAQLQQWLSQGIA